MLFRPRVGTGRPGTTGTRSSRAEHPQTGLTTFFPLGPPERLDVEKRRAKQSMEDLEKLHSKEVLSYGHPWFCCLHMGPADRPCVMQYSQCMPWLVNLELPMPELPATVPIVQAAVDSLVCSFDQSFRPRCPPGPSGEAFPGQGFYGVRAGEPVFASPDALDWTGGSHDPSPGGQ